MLLRKKVALLIDRGHARIEIARIGGIAHQTIGRFTKSGAIDLYVALRLIRHYWSEEERELIRDLCDNDGIRNLRNVLEYFIISGDLEGAVALIQKLKHSVKRHDIEWAEAYEVEVMRMQDKITPQEIIDKLEHTSFETPEMKLYSKILLAYAYHDLKKFDYVRTNFYLVELKLPHLKDDYIKQCFELRLGEVRAYMHLIANELGECRSYIKALHESVLNTSLAASLYHTLGYSYILDDAKQALHYFTKSREISYNRGRVKYQRRVENTINFVQNLHGLEAEYLNLTENVHDTYSFAYYLIRKEKKQLAQELLDQIDIESLNHYDRGFHYFYLAELTGNSLYYFDSIAEFKLAGNHFIRQLPLQKLQALNLYDESVLRAVRI